MKRTEILCKQLIESVEKNDFENVKRLTEELNTLLIITGMLIFYNSEK